MFYTYVIRSQKDGNLYTGFAKDLKKRFEKHCLGGVLPPKTEDL